MHPTRRRSHFRYQKKPSQWLHDMLLCQYLKNTMLNPTCMSKPNSNSRIRVYLPSSFWIQSLQYIWGYTLGP